MTDDPKASSSASSPDARRARLQSVRRIVVKIGSRVLVDEDNHIDAAHLGSLVNQMAQVISHGVEVTCVSSGAVAAGLRDLGLDTRPTDLPSLQAAAAIGQSRLVGMYRDAFAEHGIAVAQVLLTHDDVRSRERHLNARNTLHRLVDAGVVPVINENDTVAVDEIRVGDNDTLSALVATLVRADLLIMLTSAEGLLDRPPEEGGTLVDHVETISPEVHAMAGDAGSDVATGGMRTKVKAAEIAVRAGECAVIANGRTAHVVPRILAGEAIGTWFEPVGTRLGGRKRWIAFFDHPRGDLGIDQGAADAVAHRGGSLLPIGVTSVEGDFDRGSPVRILDPEGQEIGRGLVNFASDDIRRILGCRSHEIAARLGQCEYVEVIHRDNLVLR